MTKQPETVFITKYALSGGIFEREVDDFSGGDVLVKSAHGINGVTFYFGEGREWHRTREGAIKRAEEMRVKKIASLREQITKLEKMEF